MAGSGGSGHAARFSDDAQESRFHADKRCCRWRSGCANTVVCGVLNTLLLKPPAYSHPERVYFVNNTRFPTQSFPNYRDLRDRTRTFESLFAYRMDTMALSIGDQAAQRVYGYVVTGNYFQSVGVRPAIGRFFTTAEDGHPGASPYAVFKFYECCLGGKILTMLTYGDSPMAEQVPPEWRGKIVHATLMAGDST